MTVHVHIARLVMAGARPGRAAEAALRQAIAAELGRLLAGAPQGIAPAPPQRQAQAQAGTRIAQAIHAHLQGPRR